MQHIPHKILEVTRPILENYERFMSPDAFLSLMPHMWSSNVLQWQQPDYGGHSLWLGTKNDIFREVRLLPILLSLLRSLFNVFNLDVTTDFISSPAERPPVPEDDEEGSFGMSITTIPSALIMFVGKIGDSIEDPDSKSSAEFISVGIEGLGATGSLQRGQVELDLNHM
ncbi:hypothetical protein SDJN02_12428, partial [Cucurbita argyrosperma subsp. argyrosperma]